MRTWAVSFERSQLGWRCSVTFTLTTARKFTDETASVVGFGSRRRAAWRDARRLAAEYVAVNKAGPGERAALGWSD